MKAKKTLSIILAVFVAASIIMLVRNEISGNVNPPATKSEPSGSGASSNPADDSKGQNQTASMQGTRTIVYYFHGNMRCATCMKFEAYVKDVVASRFKDDAASGKLELKIINVDEPGNTHFVKEYELSTRTLVVSKWKDGKQVDWTNLHQIWNRVDDEADFKKYVEDEIRNMMAER